jgi:hypothetical protein
MQFAFHRSKLSTMRTRDRDFEVRRQIDSEMGRALVDRMYAATLLNDPSRVLGSLRYAIQDSTEVGQIRARSLQDLAYQLRALFWLTSSRCADPRYASRACSGPSAKSVADAVVDNAVEHHRVARMWYAA